MATVVNGASSPTTTYQDGPGNPNQGSMIWAINCACWWYFQINSANDLTGNPGTHKVSAWYNTSADPATGTWVYYGDSPNLDSTNGQVGKNANLLFRNGRSLGALYWSNPSGTNKDICHIAAGIYMASGVGNDANTIIGNLRVLLGHKTLTWGSWGVYITDNFNYSNSSVHAAFALGRGTDGRIHMGCAVLTDQLDAAAIASSDVDTGDTWTTGGRGTGNTHTNTTIDNLSNETGMAVGYACMNDGANPNGVSTNKVDTITSGTAIAVHTAIFGSVTGAVVGWTNFTPGTRTNLIIDSSMANECNCHGFAPLAGGNMLCVYDTGGQAAPNFQELSSIKGTGAISAGFWPNAGAGDAAVFGSNSTQRNNDWCLCSISLSNIYCARRTAATTCAVRSYNPITNAWAALTNAPPTMTSKTIVAAGGVCLVSDGMDMWLLVIDSTDAQVKYTKYTHGTTPVNGTWGSWTNLAAAGSTAAFLTATIANGFIVAAWSEKNANNTNYDTLTATLSVRTEPTPLATPANVPHWLVGPPALRQKGRRPNQTVGTELYVAPPGTRRRRLLTS